MKKALIIFVSLLVILLGVLLTLPYFFKDDIKAVIDKGLAASVNADINFDIDDFNVSLFPNFPNLTVGIQDFSVVGRDDFAGKVLFSTQNFEVVINLKKIIFDDQMSVQGILLDHPVIWIKVLANGKANYDIAIPSKEVEEEIIEESEEASEPFSMSIEKWQIIGADVTYDDETIPFVMEIKDLNHTGSGDFSLTVFDMGMKTDATLATISYDGVTYMKNKKLTADMSLGMDLDKMLFTFKDNEFKLNQFAMGMDGWFSMPEEGFDMDLNITSKNNSFKSVLSLIPALYATDFEGLTAAGSVEFNMNLKGMYTDERMPAFNVLMGIKDGKFQYPDLPTAVDNVQFKMVVDNKDGNIDNTKIDISKFHIELGNNPIDATLKIDNLIDYPLNLNASAHINFAEMMQLSPMEGMELKGLLDANIQAKGIYDTLTSTIPASGQFSLTDFYYSDVELLPQGMSISTAKASFTPESINLDAFDSKVGQSDFSATGKLTNYINYALKPNEVLAGNLNLTSNNILVDEFMATTETESEAITDSTSTEEESYDTAIPKNIDFVMRANLKKIEYDGLLLTDAKGKLIIKDGILDMNNLSTKTLGGKIVFNGVYDTKDPSAPKFDMDFGINNISIQESFKAFNTVQKMAPIAENMQGNLTTNFSLKGNLDKELMPINETVNGGGLLKIASAKLSGGKFVTALSKFTSKGGKEEMALKDINMNVTIENGVVNVAPFDVVIDGNKSTISGSTSLEGNLDYKIATSIPAGQLGEQANAALNKLMGSTEKPSSTVKLNLGVTGPYDSPKVSLLGSDMKAAVKEKITEAVVSKGAELAKEKLGVDVPTSKEELNEKAQAEADKLLADAQKQADKVKAEAKKAAVQIRAEAQKQSDALMKEAGSNFLKQKGAKMAGKKLVTEGDKKAIKVEAEGNKQADAIMVKAKEQADAILKKGE
ncbi:MAG: AsmA family protein [Cyclobacteriaceae bacterium]|nr:AsmA family protein [Cyclobacteriaceae bacterium]